MTTTAWTIACVYSNTELIFNYTSVAIRQYVLNIDWIYDNLCRLIIIVLYIANCFH